MVASGTVERRPVRKKAAGKAVPGKPSLREERKLLREGGHVWLAGMDEVGRGSLAGPVTVGVVVVDAETRSAPAGVRDSKLLTPAARKALVPKLRRWAPGHAVGHAEPEEIDRVGIVAALRLAAWRAIASLPVQPDCVLLDGNHNWLTAPSTSSPLVLEQPALFDAPVVAPVVRLPPSPFDDPHAPPPPAARVVTRIKADMRCAAVAAASVLAKVERDEIMVARAADHPQYGWELNKGYSAPEHIAALRDHGPCVQHRRSWSLPGLVAAGLLPPEEDTLIDLTEDL